MIITESDIKLMVKESVKKILNEFNHLLYGPEDPYSDDDGRETQTGVIDKDDSWWDFSNLVKQHPEFQQYIRPYATSDDCSEVNIGKVDVQWTEIPQCTSIGSQEPDYWEKEDFTFKIAQDNPILQQVPQEIIPYIEQAIGEDFEENRTDDVIKTV